MPIKPIVIYPDPRLREVSVKVEDPSSVKQLVEDMAQSMYAHDGAGLAAIQIGVPRQVFMIDAPIAGGTEQDPPMVFINPEVVELSEETETADEGCLSFPDIFVPIKRSRRAKFRATDLNGQRFEAEGDGLFARAMQHEFDHLNGRLIADFVGRIKRQLIQRKLARSRG